MLDIMKGRLSIDAPIFTTKESRETVDSGRKENLSELIINDISLIGTVLF